jgi:hypothetical protein
LSAASPHAGLSQARFGIGLPSLHRLRAPFKTQVSASRQAMAICRQ